MSTSAEEIINNTDPRELRNILRRQQVNNEGFQRPVPNIIINQAPQQYSAPATAGTPRRIFTFTYDGELVTYSGQIRMYNKWGVDLTFKEVFLSLGSAPTGADVIVDIHKNGTTLFTNQANRPRIVAGAQTGSTVALDISAFVADDYITMDVDQIGSTLRGNDLTVHVIFE
jgi:hypothetical protein